MPSASQHPFSLHDLTFSMMEKLLLQDGVSPTHAKPLWRALYRDPIVDVTQAAHFPAPLQKWLQAGLQRQHCTLDTLKLAKTEKSSDGLTNKFLLELNDGQQIETVVMGYTGRFTACLSTQVGCAMGCVFCATGQMGFSRHLRPGEIVAQVMFANQFLRENGHPPLRNLVLMGMGEPLHNYEGVISALEVISNSRGIGIAPSKISISTVGVVPGILKLADEPHPYNLAVSLHASTQERRASIVPASKRWSLSELMDACKTYASKTGRKIFFEWTLIAGVNDSIEQATELATLLQNLPAHLNLIPLNPTNGYEGSATNSPAVFEFQKVIQEADIPCTVRQRRGIDVAAGCGMLSAERKKKQAA